MEYKEFKITEENAKYMFNNFSTTEQLFYIEYVDSSLNSLIKVHENAEKSLLFLESREPKKVYFKYYHRANVIDIVLDIKRGNIEYSYESESQPEDIDTIIQNIFTDFDLKEQKTLFTSGSFNIDIRNFNDFNFYCFIFIVINLIEKNAANIIYMRETYNPRSLKKRSKYYFRDFENLNNLDYVLSFTIDNIMSNLYNIKYRAKNKEKDYIIDVSYLIKKFMIFYEENSITEDGNSISYEFVKDFYDDTFEYKEKTYSRIPNKITNLRNKSKSENIFPGGGEYTKSMCECKLQPIIIDKEDIEDWEKYEDFNKIGTKIKHRSMLFPPKNSSQGPKKYYICPTHEHPVPILKQNTGLNARNYPYLPCCKVKGNNMFYNSYEETRLRGNGPIVSLKQSELQTKSLPLPLQSFFKNFVNDDVEIKPVEVSVDNSFAACVLHGTKDYEPPVRIALKKRFPNYLQVSSILKNFKLDYKKNIHNFRREILRLYGDISVLKQEMFDYSDEDISKTLKNEEYLDSRLFFRLFESIFSINVFVFYISNEKPILETPRYKDFHIRNINEDLPSLFLYRDITSSQGRYSIISGRQKLYSSKNIQGFLQPYYRSDITEDNKTITRLNPYRDIIWEKIFKNNEIYSQRINKEGKCYCINIGIEDSEISVYIPLSAPLNIPTLSKISKGNSNKIKKYFGEGNIGSEGLWYYINGLREIFIPCEDVDINLTICKNFLKDKLSQEIDKNYNIFNMNLDNSSKFIEICIWIWRTSMLSLDEWFGKFIKESQKTDIFEKDKLDIEFMLPSYNSTEECLKWIRDNNPIFSEVFRDDGIYIYPELRENIYLYLSKIDSITKGLPNFPSKFLTTSLIDKEDFKKTEEEIFFTNLRNLEEWKEDRFNEVEIYNDLENRDMYIYQSDKGMYLVKTTSTINEAMLLSVFWLKKKKFLDPSSITNKLLNTVIERYGYKLYDKNLKIIKEQNKQSNLEIIKYSSDIYSTFLKII